MRGRRRSRQVPQVLGARPAPRRAPRDGKNRACARDLAGARREGAVLPHGGLGGVQHGGEEDGGAR